MRFHDHHGPDRAAAVAYYTLLSLVPLLIFLISLGMAVLGSFEAAYRGSMMLVRGVTIHLDAKSQEGLRNFVEHAQSFRLPGLILLAWTARRIFASMFSALELVFGVPGRSFAKHNLVALSMVMVTGVALLLSMAFTMLSAGSQGILMQLRSSGEFKEISFYLGQLLPVVVTFTFFFVLYRFVPRRVTTIGNAAIGALLATVLWEVAKSAFAWYLRDVARFSNIYGTLVGIIVLALWLEISVSIILYCGEVVALLIHQKTAERTAAMAATAADEPTGEMATTTSV
jgi:membrane protein